LTRRLKTVTKCTHSKGTKMNKFIKTSMLYALLSMLYIGAANAMCPVCTVVVGSAAIGARSLGVSEAIIGIWVAGLAMSIMFWMWAAMKKRDANGLLFLFPPVFAAGLLFAIYTVFLTMGYEQNMMFGINKYFAGIIIGLPAFLGAAIWHLSIKRKRGGKSWFPMQKVVWPVGALLIASGIMWGVLQYTDAQPCPTKNLPPCPDSIEIIS